MRGKPFETSTASHSTRITPAGAGKTIKSQASKRGSQDHPRRCGENVYDDNCAVLEEGSPPQVRGKPVFSTIFSASVRITPAGAGKTRACKRTDGSYRDHPRRCGENRAVIAALNSSLGSPPQVRGKLRGHLSAVKQNGITPAGAGKTAAIRQLLQAN